MSKKTTYKCGKCGELGHNARTCPNKTTASQAEPEAHQEPEPEPAPEKEEKKPDKKKRASKVAAPNTVVVDATVDLLNTDRTRPPRPAGPGCFQCPNCNRASVLVLVQLPEERGGEKEMRCELCHNRTPIAKILLWGAQPTDINSARK